jgi:hypothetical protein
MIYSSRGSAVVLLRTNCFLDLSTRTARNIYLRVFGRVGALHIAAHVHAVASKTRVIIAAS